MDNCSVADCNRAPTRKVGRYKNSRPPGRYIGRHSNIWSQVEGTRCTGIRNGLRGNQAGSNTSSARLLPASRCLGGRTGCRRIAPAPSRNSCPCNLFPGRQNGQINRAGLDGTGLCVGEGGNKYRESMRIGSCRSDRCNGRRSCKGCCSIRPRLSRNAFPSSLSNATLSFSMDNTLPNNIPSGH